MRTSALLLAALMAMSTSTAAFAQQAKRAKAKPAAATSQPADPNENTKRLLWDGLPLVMPAPIRMFMLQQKSEEAKKAERRP